MCLFFQSRRQLLQMECLFVWLPTLSVPGSRRLREMILRTRLTPFRGLCGTRHQRFSGALRAIVFGMQAFEMVILSPLIVLASVEWGVLF